MFGAQKLDRNHVLSASDAVWELVSGFNFHCLSEASFDQILHFFTSTKWLEATTGLLSLPPCELWIRGNNWGFIYTNSPRIVSPYSPSPCTVSARGWLREWLCVGEGMDGKWGGGPVPIAKGSAPGISDCSWVLMAFLLCRHFPLSPKETLCNTC